MYIFVCAISDENSDEEESVNVCHVPDVHKLKPWTFNWALSVQS